MGGESLSWSLTEPFSPTFSLGVHLPRTHLPAPPSSSRTFSNEESVPHVRWDLRGEQIFAGTVGLGGVGVGTEF